MKMISLLWISFFPFLYCDAPYLKKEDIYQIFEKYVKPNYTEQNEKRYCPLPRYKNTTSWRWEGKDFPRIIALLEFERFIKDHQIFSEKTLAVEGYCPSVGYDPECLILPHSKLMTTSFQTKPNEHDLHNLQIDEDDFDFVMVNQVLEHVYDPIRCLQNIHKYMKKGGILYINVPTVNLPHDTPLHFYTGITPVGLGAIVTAAGFEILSIGHWGNYEYINYIFKNYDWPDYRSLNNPGLNDVRHPVISWIFAIKKE